MKWLSGILILFTVNSKAQVPVIDTQHPQKGIYRTIEEFRNNTPSEQGDLVIKTRSTAAQIYLLANKNELRLRDASGAEHKVKNYWGYCDGNNFYIRDYGLNKLLKIGYYCIYEVQTVQPSRGYLNSTDMSLAQFNPPVPLKKVLNIVTGEKFDLTAYNLKKYILPQDSALLEEFRTDRSKRSSLDYYIVRFNQRNKPAI